MADTSEDAPVGYTRKNLKQHALAIGVKSDVVVEALERFECAAEASEPTRKKILAAKRFRALDQWPEQVRNQRTGAASIQGVAAQPARPCLTIDRVSGPTRQVSNMVRQSDFVIDTIPVGSGTDKDLAQIFKGWIRRVQNESRAEEPVEWAADSAAEGGIGWFRICTYYTDVDPKFPFDQDVRLERVPNSLSIYYDPYAQKPTKSDMRFLLQTEDMSKEEFKERYPDADMASLEAFHATGDTGGWIDRENVRIADYWCVEQEKVRVAEMDNGVSYEGDAIPKGAKIRRERFKFVPHVKFYKITAVEVLEQTEWAGTRIPYVPIIGEEINVDGVQVVRGVIEPAMDAQRMLNYSYSAAIESAALAPKAPWVVAEGQIDQYKPIWQNSATTNFAYLVYTPVSLLGTPVPPPTRNVAEQPIQAFVQLMAASEEAIKFTTNTFDPSLGNSNPRERSGSAIEALQQKSDFTQSSYLDNVVRAQTYAGELLVELGPKILDRPGRILQILQEPDDSPQHVMLQQPFTTPTQGGMPQPVMNPQTQQPVMDPDVAKLVSATAKFYDPTAAKFGVVVTVTKDRATKRVEESAALGELIPHLPPPMQASLTPEFISTLDFADADKIADIARKSLPPEMQAMLDPNQQMTPKEQQLMAQVQQQNMALQQAKQIIDTEQVKANYQMQREQIITQRELHLANVNNAAKILVAHITAAKEAGMAQDEGRLEQVSTGIEAWNARLLDAQDKLHEFRMSQLEHQQTMEQADQAHQHALAQGAQGIAGDIASAQAQPQPQGAGA